MKFESSRLPETAGASDSTTTKDKKKNRAPVQPAIAPESIRALARPAVTIESVISEKPAEISEKSEKPAVGLTEMLAPKSDEKSKAGKESSEEDKSVENLDATERQKVAEAYVEAVAPEVAAEVADTKDASAEQVEAAANLALLAELKARLGAETPPEEALEGAYQSVAQTLETPAEAVPTSEFTTEAATEDADAGEEIAEVVSEETYPESTAPVRVRDAEYVGSTPPAEQAEEPEPAAAAGAGGVTPPPSPPKPPASSGASAGGSYGPRTPGPTGGARTPVTEAAPFAAAAASMTERPVIHYNTSQARGLLAGGILGYLIGRRRGRIKTEKRLLPVQKKLESQVKDLHQKISVKEQQIRTLAHQKAETETVARKRQELVQHLKKEHAVPALSALERARPAPAAEVAARSAERPIAAAETVQPVAAASEKPAQKAEEMNLASLLMVAETITVDRQPLRKMYESGNLDERSLRRAVSEHLRGGNVHEVVAREMVTKQLSFESDPRLRQAGTKAAAPLAGASSVATADTGRDPGVLPNPLPAPAVNSAYKADGSAAPQHPHNPSTTALVVVVALALALAVAALII